MEDSDRGKTVKKAVDTAAGKVVNKLIFGLRDSLNQDAFSGMCGRTGETL